MTTVQMPCTECGDLTATQQLTGRRGQPMALPTQCPDCADAVRARNEAEERAWAAQAAKQKAERRLNDSGIPTALRGHRLDTLDDIESQATALATARRVVDGELTALTLVGPVGTGKTTIAAATAMSLLESNAVRWVSVPALVARLDMRFGSEEREDALSLLHDSHGLVLDDLDKARATEHVAMHIFTAIDSRIAEGAPLIVTANLRPSALADRWPQPHGEAIVSRLASGTICVVDGADLRTPA